MAKGIKILRRTNEQTQEEFKDDVCMEFNEFLEDFIIEGGAYYSLYQTIIDRAMPEWVWSEPQIRFRVVRFAGREINKIIDIAKKAEEAPVVDTRYYRDLYRKYEGSDKSLTILQQITNEFLSVFNEMTRLIDFTYDKVFQQKIDSSTKNYVRPIGQTKEEFKDNARAEYKEFVAEFFAKHGAYLDMYKAMLDYSASCGQAANNQFLKRVNLFYNKINNEVEEIIEEKNEVPWPNLAYYRALYKKYEESDKSPNTMEQMTNEFLSAINELISKLEKKCKSLKR